MGSGDWFRAIINSKKVKDDNSKQVKSFRQEFSASKSNGFKWKNWSRKSSAGSVSGCISDTAKALDVPDEDLAATRIQTAFRAYLARKTLRSLKRTVKLQILIQNNTTKRYVTALSYLHLWSHFQAHIRARRICMATEGRLRQKKLENKLKLEAKLHELKVEWCGGSETLEEVLGRIHQRKEAATRRERAMAYAFSHQWRANSGLNLGLVNYEFGKANWGWSWKERWISARPWESRVPAAESISPKKEKALKVGEKNNPPANNVGENTSSPSTKVNKVSENINSTPAVRSKVGENTNSLSNKANKVGVNTNSLSPVANEISESTKLTTAKVPLSSKVSLSSGKGASKARRSLYPVGES